MCPIILLKQVNAPLRTNSSGGDNAFVMFSILGLIITQSIKLTQFIK